ncbi:CDC45-like protein [Oesophagostomum dentatum]|uniref:CDC45-like protein n=1 Tax=Oesophagostomum dentatum TaxID=61180 RepID=A0A0B1T9A5_OESDE|nr:CDC45-like protein [Oesophagostomum dentatum]
MLEAKPGNILNHKRAGEAQLFICDDVSFSTVPVNGWENLDRTFREHYDQSPAVVLINCGGNRSLQDMQVPEGSKVFVMDSRRPFHHENIFEGEQIMIMVDSAEFAKLNVPEMSAVIENDESEESDEDDEEEGAGGRRGMEKVERRLLKKEAKKQWQKRRRNLLWKYYENAWYSISSAVRMLELAAALNKATPELMWVAAVGLNSQWTDNLITVEAYHDVCIDRMRPFIHRFSPRNSGAKADDLLRVSFEKELTLNETRQKFEAMTSTRRKEVIQTLEKEMTPSFATFIAHFGYSNRVCAADVARGLAARLESPKRTPLVERFESARSILRCFMKSNQDYLPLAKSFDLYKIGLECVWTLVAAAVNQQEILPVGPFYLHSSTHHLAPKQAGTVFKERVLTARDCLRSTFRLVFAIIYFWKWACDRNAVADDIMDSKHFLFLFTTFLQRAFSSVRRSRDRTTKPLVVSLALSGEMQGWHVVTGVMPLDTVYKDAQLMSFMGRAFERAAEQASLDVWRDNFDPNVIYIRSEDRSRFFDLLQAVMEIES